MVSKFFQVNSDIFNVFTFCHFTISGFSVVVTAEEIGPLRTLKSVGMKTQFTARRFSELQPGSKCFFTQTLNLDCIFLNYKVPGINSSRCHNLNNN